MLANACKVCPYPDWEIRDVEILTLFGTISFETCGRDNKLISSSGPSRNNFTRQSCGLSSPKR